MSIGSWPVAAQQLARTQQKAWPTHSDNLTKQRTASVFKSLAHDQAYSLG
jgi:hypothetical protein